MHFESFSYCSSTPLTLKSSFYLKLGVFIGMYFILFHGFAQKNTLYGGIYTKDGIPLAGATVSTPNGKGTITDESGLFTLSFPLNVSPRLLIRSLGYKSQDTLVEASKTNSFLRFVLEEKTFELQETEIKGKRLTAFDNRYWKIFDFEIINDQMIILYSGRNGKELGLFSLNGKEIERYQVPKDIKKTRIGCRQALYLLGKDSCLEYSIHFNKLAFERSFTLDVFKKRIEPCLFKLNNEPVLKTLSSFNKKAQYFTYTSPGKMQLLKEVFDEVGQGRARGLYSEIITMYHQHIGKVDFNIITDGYWDGDLMDLAVSYELFREITNFLKLEIHPVDVQEFVQNDTLLLMDYINKKVIKIDRDSLNHQLYSIKGVEWKTNDQFYQDSFTEKIYFLSRKKVLSKCTWTDQRYELTSSLPIHFIGEFPSNITFYKSQIYYFSSNGGFPTRLHSQRIPFDH